MVVLQNRPLLDHHVRIGRIGLALHNLYPSPAHGLEVGNPFLFHVHDLLCRPCKRLDLSRGRGSGRPYHLDDVYVLGLGLRVRNLCLGGSCGYELLWVKIL